MAGGIFSAGLLRTNRPFFAEAGTIAPGSVTWPKTCLRVAQRRHRVLGGSVTGPFWISRQNPHVLNLIEALVRINLDQCEVSPYIGCTGRLGPKGPARAQGNLYRRAFRTDLVELLSGV